MARPLKSEVVDFQRTYGWVKTTEFWSPKVMLPQKLLVWVAPDLVALEGKATVLARREYKVLLGSAVEIAVKMSPEVWAGTADSA